MNKLLVTLLVLLVTATVQADYVVEENSSHVGFASVKNGKVAENHSFTGISGGVDNGGNAMVAIILSTVETMIPIRNERMRTMLFDVSRYPLATVRSKLNLGDFTSLSVGDSRMEDIDLNISMHGQSVDKRVQVKVTRISGNEYDVASTGPVMIHASELGMEGGIKALRDVAGLQSIEPMVPVTFNLRLSKI